MRTNRTRLLLVAASLALGGAAHAATAWDEGLQGDLSNDGLDPTTITVGLGSNVVLGTTGNAGQGIDRDYFRFTVPDGAVWSGLTLLPSSGVSGASSFIGVQAGPQLTVTPTGGGAENLLGFLHYSPDMAGTELMPFIHAAPLPSGTYSIWVQELGGTVPYGFDFTVSAVPEPATAALMALGLIAVSAISTAARRRSVTRTSAH